MYNLMDLIEKTIKMGASDLHIAAGYYITMRIDGKLEIMDNNILTADDTFSIVKQILDDRQLQAIEDKGDVDLSMSVKDSGRFRLNVFKQRGSYSLAIRAVSLTIPTLEELGLPAKLKDLTREKRGMILVTGPTGSGKSTTLASMIDIINNERNNHIITLEDPIEYLHRHKKCIVNQREMGSDFSSFAQGLKSCLRQDPDVILLGEMRDLESIEIALTAAETGHLVFSTLHTIGSAATVDRIIDVFPPHQQQQVAIQLANVLVSVVSQQLLVKNRGGRTVATEIMVATPAIKNTIREKKTHQIMSSIQTGAKYGMHSMDSDLINLYRKDVISKDTLFNACIDKEYIKRFVMM
jgi:twitching motility protein PilT